MKFRTEIGPLKGSFKIDHSDSIVMLGSCFADNIGSRLERDGFNVIHNPLGPLFNPASIAAVLTRGEVPFGPDDLVEHDGVWHCMYFASRYRADTPDGVLAMVNADWMPLAAALKQASVLMVTFGTDRVYELKSNRTIVGNCHKLPGNMFDEYNLLLDEIFEKMQPVQWPAKAVLTLSPVKYPGEGLARGFLSKANLRVAIDYITADKPIDYFPAYEIVTEDLRDYRFYAPDLKHPSEQAADYIYEHFADTYFTDDTRRIAEQHRREAARAAHRTIID